MNSDSYPSQILANAVREFAQLPGVGKKTALRLVLYLLKQEKNDVFRFADSLRKLREEIVYCKSCYNISDTEVCQICASPKRDHSTVCVVENIKDVMAVENTQQYFGIYHVLGGVISPMDGIGPDDITVNPLLEKVKAGQIKELIFALPTTMEGDTTNFYLYRKFSDTNIKITTLARGVSIGDELEYTDEVTLGRSLINRLPFEKTL
ncbi:recombination mediator RecR [Saccharicrinis fermentans]|uniref:Recombination protein RecR n=1 Tax=Saccharicrinis fermentans DSM 9555 = JCM 21142 TaxID=869213 RepID=W7XTU6_9BACT|nr:recombination mediator RecR [Saccharicrinis fermentans]GAF01420.1 recombination protein RecR [Saccharicrinis fermentans DSM 9555 = JCM 21142]